MEQRRLRLGDILDDYCPRERRVTNHAVVAMIEEDVKQTRCTTCDAEHAYKGGKLPRRRKKETPGALYKEVLAGMPEGDAVPVLAVPAGALPVDVPIDAAPVVIDPAPLAIDVDEPVAPHADLHASESALTSDEEPQADVVPQVEEGPVHRPLIRATLPRPEGQKDTRPVPEFTIRQAGGRGGNGHFRSARPARGHAGTGGGNGNGNRASGQRFQGSRPAGQGRGPRPEQNRGSRPDQSRGPGGRGGQGRAGAQGGGFRGRKRSR